MDDVHVGMPARATTTASDSIWDAPPVAARPADAGGPLAPSGAGGHREVSG